MLTGQTTRLLPLREANSEQRQTIPILRAPGDAAPNRIGAINWRSREFFAEDSNGLVEPFFGLCRNGFSADFEYLAETGSVLPRGGISPTGIAINATDNTAALSRMDGSFASIGTSSLTQLAFIRELIRRHIHVRCMYIRSSRNANSDFRTRGYEEEIHSMGAQHVTTRLSIWVIRPKFATTNSTTWDFGIRCLNRLRYTIPEQNVRRVESDSIYFVRNSLRPLDAPFLD